MPITPVYSLRYPASTDTADVPRDIGNLATDVDNAIGPRNPPAGIAANECSTWNGTAWARSSAMGLLVASLTSTGAVSAPQFTATSNSGFVAQSVAGSYSYRNFLLAADTQPAFFIQGNGVMGWGPGGSTSTDTTLARRGVGQIQIGSPTQAGQLVVYPATTAGACLTCLVAADANPTWQMYASGEMRWGPGGGTVWDASLARTGTATLTMNGAGGFYTNNGPISTGPTLANAGGGGSSGVYLAPTGLGRIHVCCANTNDGVFRVSWVSDTQYRFYIDSGGLMQWGPGGATVLDTTQYRAAANTIALKFSSTWGTYQAAAFAVQSERSTKSAVQKLAKTKVGELVGGLLEAGVYTYKREAKGERHLGLMADELPEDVVLSGTAVDYGPVDDNGLPGEAGEEYPMQFVDLYKLATALVATVQHLNERLQALEGAKA